MTEKEARWGSKTVEGSGHQESLRLDELRAQVLKSDRDLKEAKSAHLTKPSVGYGGKFGIMSDRQDKVRLRSTALCTANGARRPPTEKFGFFRAPNRMNISEK